MPNGTKKRSNSNSYPSTDPTNARHSPITDSNPNIWNGSQADQAQWLNAKLREAEGDYIFNALVATGAVPITTRGYTAVFGPQHALEHLAGENIGTFKNPNMRDREDLNALRTASTTRHRRQLHQHMVDTWHRPSQQSRQRAPQHQQLRSPPQSCRNTWANSQSNTRLPQTPFWRLTYATSTISSTPSQTTVSPIFGKTRATSQADAL